MKKQARWIAALVVLAIVPMVGGQERDTARDKSRDELMREMEMRTRQLDLEKRQSEISFENEMRKIQLDLKRIELERERQSLQTGGPRAPVAGPPGMGDRGPGAFRPMGPCPLGMGDRGPGGPLRGHGPIVGLALMAVCVAVNILLAVWVHQDIRKRNTGSRIWVAIVLLAGFFGGLLYALVRIGDRQG